MKILSLFFSALLTALLFAGCNTAETSVRSGNTRIELSVVTSYGGDDGNRKNFEAAVKNYEEESGNTVKDSSGAANEDWKARVLADFEAGAEPDVLFFFTGVDSDKIIKSGKVVPIDEIREKYPGYASNMRDDMLATAADGKKYSVPVNGYWEGLYVNKTVLSKCGVPLPDKSYTWEHFIRDCEKIAENGYVPIACSLGEIPHYWFEFAVYNNGSAETHSRIPLSADDEAGKIWAAGLADLKDLYERGFFPRNTNTATDSETFQMMADDKAAFAVDGSWRIGWFEKNVPDRIDDFTIAYVPGKGERRATDIIAGISMGYYITRKAWDNPEKQAACVDFVKAMTTDEVVNMFGTSSVCALKSGVTEPAGASSLVKAAFRMTGGSTKTVPTAQDALNRGARADLFNNVKNVVTGVMTPEEAIERCLLIKE